MRTWLNQLKLRRVRQYSVSRLVDFQPVDEFAGKPVQIICDIDKTYLETEFESLIRMARIAFEDATDKVTVSGAAEVLVWARWGDLQVADAGPEFPRPLHFVSSSPPQLRGVLEEKLTNDGLDFTSDTFKNQAYNIRMGRMDMLRHHVGYKTLAILNIMSQADEGSRFFMIGDSAESDAYIYLGLRLFMGGRLNPGDFAEYLRIAGVAPEVVEQIRGQLPECRCQVPAILIRRVPGSRMVAAPPLTTSVRYFSNWLECALVLHKLGLVPDAGLWPLARSFINQHGMLQAEVSATLQSWLRWPGNADGGAVVAAVLERLPGAPAAAGTPDQFDHLAPPQDSLMEMPAADILRAARLWMQQIRSSAHVSS